MNMIHVILQIIILWGDILVSMASEVMEVCQFEQFKAKCDPGHVIIMTMARYGRVKLGRCVREDMGLGCTADILMLMDKECSGRQECVIDIPMVEFEKYTGTRMKAGCSKELKMHLEAAYKCVKVQTSHTMPCLHNCHDDRITIHNKSGFLSSYIAYETECGSSNCPWHIQVKPGQKLNLTLYDFETSRYMKNPSSRILYARITETSGAKDVYSDVFGGFTSDRIGNVYMSKGNAVTVQFLPSMNNNHFLLHYNAVGCPTIQTPPHGWVKQESSGVSAQIGCNKDGASVWTLRCNGTEWVGHFENCSFHSEIPPDSVGGNIPLTNLMIVIIIIGVAVFICSSIVAIGICCFRGTPPNNNNRHRLQQPPPYDVTYDIGHMTDHIKLTSPNEDLPRKCEIHDVPLTKTLHHGSPHPRHLQHHSNTMGRHPKHQYEQIWEKQQASRKLHMKNTL